jgi:hypothetical protein
MIHRENERSEHQKIRGAAYTLTEDLIRHIKEKAAGSGGGVWFATHEQIARHVAQGLEAGL